MHYLLFITILAGAILFARHGARSHEFYPFECCSDKDCYQIVDDEVEEVQGGYKIKATGELWPYNKTRNSPDGHFHRCSTLGDRKKGTICLFAPKPSF